MALLRRKKRPSDDQPSWLVVGLGNPGDRYASTRHNAGARAVERFADLNGFKLKKAQLQAVLGASNIDGVRITAARLLSWYNDSGIVVASLLKKLGIGSDRLLVLHDDIDLRAHILRSKFGGGSAGNHGIESIEAVLKTREFFRVRIGVGRPLSTRQDPADFVLERMSKKEAEEFAVTEAIAADAALCIIQEGLDRAMSKFNTK